MHITRPGTRGILFLAALLIAAGTADAGSWSMFHGDARHSGLTLCDAPHDSLFGWSYATGDSIVYSSPIVGPDGTVYVGTLGKDLVALSFFGEPLWTFRGDGNFRYSTPARSEDGTIYIGGSNNHLYAVDAHGSRKWTFEAGGAVKTSPNIGSDGTIYFGADDGLLYAVRPDSTLAWTFATGDTIRSSPAIAPDGTILVGSNDGNLYAVRPDGSLRWSAATGAQIKYCSPAISETGEVYFGSYDGNLYAVTVDQTLLWVYPTGNVLRSSPALGLDGRVYIGSGSRLLAINAAGELEWDFSTGGSIYGSPVYWEDDDVVGVGSLDGTFYLLHADGSLDWTFTVGAPIYTTPAPSRHGDLYVADVSGRVWAMGNATTAVEWEPPVGRGALTLLGPNPTPGGVWLQWASKTEAGPDIQVLDATGRLVRRLPSDPRGRIHWDGTAASGQPVSPGAYFLRADQAAHAVRVLVVR